AADTNIENAMLFNSYIFWIFYAVVAVLYFRLRHRGQNLLLLVASYYFYACWDWRFLGLLLASTVSDFFVGLWMNRIESPARRKALLFASLGINLGVLGFFKYYGFFAGELQTLL